jgi:hypothetical protein
MSISISVILFNKWLLAFSGFPFPISLTVWHMTFCTSVGTLAVRVFKVVKSHNMSRRDYVRRVMPIGEGAHAEAACSLAVPSKRRTKQLALRAWNTHDICFE